MAEEKTELSIEPTTTVAPSSPATSDRPDSPRDEKIQEKVQNGIVLIPRPLDDPRDPLNWPFRKKCTITAVLCLALFAGYAAPFCGQLNLIQQSKLYHKTTIQISYFVSIKQISIVKLRPNISSTELSILSRPCSRRMVLLAPCREIR